MAAFSCPILRLYFLHGDFPVPFSGHILRVVSFFMKRIRFYPVLWPHFPALFFDCTFCMAIFRFHFPAAFSARRHSSEEEISDGRTFGP